MIHKNPRPYRRTKKGIWKKKDGAQWGEMIMMVKWRTQRDWSRVPRNHTSKQQREKPTHTSRIHNDTNDSRKNTHTHAHTQTEYTMDDSTQPRYISKHTQAHVHTQAEYTMVQTTVCNRAVYLNTHTARTHGTQHILVGTHKPDISHHLPFIDTSPLSTIDKRAESSSSAATTTHGPTDEIWEGESREHLFLWVRVLGTYHIDTYRRLLCEQRTTKTPQVQPKRKESWSQSSSLEFKRRNDDKVEIQDAWYTRDFYVSATGSNINVPTWFYKPGYTYDTFHTILPIWDTREYRSPAKETQK